MNPDPDRSAVIVGVGEVVDRGRDPRSGREPLALMVEALQAAAADAGAALLPAVDALDVVCEYSWPYADAPGLVAQRLGLPLRHARTGVAGGESPLSFIHEAALRIQRGDCAVAAVVGAEAAWTVAAAFKSGVQLDWQPRDPRAELLTGREFSAPVAVDHGVFVPTHVYPFYETATQAHWGQTQRAAQAESGAICSAFSKVAAANPMAWTRSAYAAEAIVTPAPDNRLVAWPYTKRMVANPLVNQGAAVLLTSLARARALGIAPERIVHVWGGAAAKEPRDYLQRDGYTASHAQDAVLRAAQTLADDREFAAVELYSCFPCVPKMARRCLGLAVDQALTVTGGLSFFGAPLNNYMTHAAAAMVRTLRARRTAPGLLYGQGEFVTKHHALVLGAQPAPQALLAEDYGVQSRCEAAYGTVPQLLLDYAGPARVEAYTLSYARDGGVEFGTVIARTPGGARLMARVPADDAGTLALLTDADAIPVGSDGRVTRLDARRLRWQAA